MTQHPSPSEFQSKSPLSFLWVELTNQCNLECIHCYADSSPTAVDHNPLSSDQYVSMITDAFNVGCREIQFIGGEPTLNKNIENLISLAEKLGFEKIEIFTNLLSLPEKIFQTTLKSNASIATSMYSFDPLVHDKITARSGSWNRTVKNLKRILEADLNVRVGIIEMAENTHHIDGTMAFLRELGVSNIGIDRLRSFGRGAKDITCSMNELCGECANGTLCISPEGIVSPCIMSKAWAVGSIFDDSIGQILSSSVLDETRARIRVATDGRLIHDMGGCQPNSPNRCAPDSGGPCYPCSPSSRCGPNGCQPQ